MASVTCRTVAELAAAVDGEVIGEASRPISGVSGLAEAGPSQLAFFGSPRYREQLAKTRAGCVLVGHALPERTGTTWIRVPHPHLAFARISRLFHPVPRPVAGVDPRAQVHEEAEVDPTATVLGLATVGRFAKVGARSVLHPGAYVGEGAVVGEDCVLYPNVVVREGCELGDRVILQPGCVVGSDGFGFAFDPKERSHVKIPQVGTVRVEDDVELGACTCVDRATSGRTVVGRGAKVDNLVQLAHNVRVGPLSLICAQAGVSGSAELGTGVVLAGQVGVVGHLRLGDGVKVGAQSGVGHDVAPGEVVSGSPAVRHSEWLRMSAALPRLSSMSKDLRALKRRISELEKERDP